MARLISLTVAFVFVTTIGVGSATAQGTPGRPARPQPTPAPSGGRPQTATAQPTTRSSTGDVPLAKVAVIYSADFQNAKTGIAKYISAISKLDAEFQPIQNELTATARRLNQQQTEIQTNTTLAPAQLQAKIDLLDQQKKEYQRKGEDAQSSYQRRRNQLLGPLQEEVGRALDAYALARGITLIIDGSRVPIIYAAESIDITKSFIADYNSKNPATASTTTPK